MPFAGMFAGMYHGGNVSSPGGSPRIFLDLGKKRFETSAASPLKILSRSSTIAHAGGKRKTLTTRFSEASLSRKTMPSPIQAPGSLLNTTLHSRGGIVALVRRITRVRKGQGSMLFKAENEVRSGIGLRRRVEGLSATLARLARQSFHTRKTHGSQLAKAEAETSSVAETEDDLSLIAQALEEE